MTITEQREAVRLYKEGAGTASEIAKIYGVHYSTIFDTLTRFNVPRQRPSASVAVSAAMRRRWAENKARQAQQQAVYSPDLRDQYLVAEQPAPLPGVNIDAVHVKAKRKPRKRKSWLRRILDKVFGRR
jgi:hypothetical protein